MDVEGNPRLWDAGVTSEALSGGASGSIVAFVILLLSGLFHVPFPTRPVNTGHNNVY
jgi:hypothetical protein